MTSQMVVVVVMPVYLHASPARGKGALPCAFCLCDAPRQREMRTLVAYKGTWRTQSMGEAHSRVVASWRVGRTVIIYW